MEETIRNCNSLPIPLQFYVKYWFCKLNIKKNMLKKKRRKRIEIPFNQTCCYNGWQLILNGIGVSNTTTPSWIYEGWRRVENKPCFVSSHDPSCLRQAFICKRFHVYFAMPSAFSWVRYWLSALTSSRKFNASAIKEYISDLMQGIFLDFL